MTLIISFLTMKMYISVYKIVEQGQLVITNAWYNIH